MTAFVMKKIDEVGMMEKPVPEPGPNDAVIRTTLASISTSDVYTAHGAIGERNDLTLGHEAVGVVHRLGEAVDGFEEGQRVAVPSTTPCFRCENCQRGHTSQCQGLLGAWKLGNSQDGCFADYFLVSDAGANLFAIPDDISDEQAVYCTNTLSAGLKAAENADIPVGGAVAVFGQGAVGLMATVGARLMGAGLIIAVETISGRQELSREFGADEIVDHKKEGPVDRILEMTDAIGVDAAIEASGTDQAFEACVKSTRPGGTISNVGYHKEGVYMEIPRVEWGAGKSDKTIRAALAPGGSERMKRMFRLIRNERVDPTKLTTHRFEFAEIEKAFHMKETNEDGIIKPVISFDADS